MKKILASLLVLALCAPAMAATVSFVDNEDGTGTFTITTVGVGDESMVGLGLDVTADAGITAVAVPAAFNVYPDAGYTIGATFDPWGVPAVAGTPICAVAAPGEIALPGTAGTFAICFANLNAPPTPGAPGAQTVAITITAPDGTVVTIGENAARGGVVGTNGEDIALTGTLTGTITVAPTGPTCHDYNLNGDGFVNANDINVFIAYVNANKSGPFFSIPSTSGAYRSDYDLNSDNFLNANDINVLIGWVNANKTGPFFSVPCS